MCPVYTIYMPTPYNVIFLGTSAFAVPSLEALITHPGFTVDLVITQPDRPVGRRQVLTAPPVKDVANQYHISVFQPEKLNKEFSTYSREHALGRPDFLVVVSYGQIISQAVLDFPLIAPVNVHASLLPRWRGASPIQQAILAGDTETGVTIQKMIYELDAGPILGERSMPLTGEETAPGLHDELARMGSELLMETLLLPLFPREQNHTHATHCKKLTREDGIVDPQTMTAEEIHRKVRGLMPWPGVTTTINDETIKILRSSLIETTDSTLLPCNDHTILYLEEVQVPGGKPMSGKAWLGNR
ncbi:MAG: methionyl-tRNA formyltransferase [Candidatus Peribacteria bacterium]|nr:methionyl-tRNA formyltransferase [Candidatus Peribacteria bacterium]